MTIDVKKLLSSSYMRFFNKEGYCFRQEQVYDDYEFPQEYSIHEPILRDHIHYSGLITECVGYSRRKFKLYTISSIGRQRVATYEEVD